MAEVYSIDEIKTIVSDVAKQYGVKKQYCSAHIVMAILRDNPEFCVKYVE